MNAITTATPYDATTTTTGSSG
ncbi:MAG: hypothetical protein JWP77_10, partial [Polaromonas sp.]|nr:hypothetical protein [Polaromonas sp.]